MTSHGMTQIRVHVAQVAQKIFVENDSLFTLTGLYYKHCDNMNNQSHGLECDSA